jgi:DNA primase
MRVPDSVLHDIKSRVRLSDLVSRSVSLRKQGKEYAGLSPFTAEKTPSFYVNDEKAFFKDFSSGKFGDCFRWLMETERLSFMEAVERLASETGIELPRQDRALDPEQALRYRLYRVMEAAGAWFEHMLRSPAGHAARLYLEGRGLGPDTWGRHEIGFAPEGWRTLSDAMRAQGFEEADLLAAGLLSQAESARTPYDKFRNRIMFAIRDPQGRLCAFGGRVLNKDDKPKYLNSPETPIFSKGHLLYRFPEARKAAAEGRKKGLIVVEGYMDAIALAEAGFGEAVAPLGTALTADQLALLWKAGPEPVVCLDGDRPGREAAWKLIDRALPVVEPGRSVYFARLPDGLDPDDVLRRQGPEAMAGVLKAAEPMIAALWEREVAREPTDTPERLAAFEASVLASAEKIAHPIVRRAYLQELRRRLRDHAWNTRRAREPANIGPPGSGRARPGRAGPEVAYGQVRFAERGLGLMLQAVGQPALIGRAREPLARIAFDDPDVEAIRDVILDLHDGPEGVDVDGVERHLRTLGRDRAASHVARLRFCAGEAAEVEAGTAGHTSLTAVAPLGDVRAGEADEAVLAQRKRTHEWLRFIDRLANHGELQQDAERARIEYEASLAGAADISTRRLARERYMALTAELRAFLRSLEVPGLTEGEIS